MKNNIIIFYSIIILFAILNNYNNKVYSYLIFPLEYLPNQNYKFIKDNNLNTIFPEEIIQQIYYKNLITKFEIGSPLKKIILLLQTNSEKFYLSSFNSSAKPTQHKFYQFLENEFYNESLSKTNTNTTCEQSKYFPYNIICQSKDIINFNINKTFSKKEFEFKLIKNSDENIPGYIGLLHNDSNYEYTKGFITELKAAKLINNYSWFFDFDEFLPLEKRIKGKFIVGGLPHEIYPKKYSFDDLESTSSEESSLSIGRAWRLKINKIYIDDTQNKIEPLTDKVITFNYEIYNIISSIAFRFDIEDLLMDELIKDGKCFKSSFSQNLYSEYNLTFYYFLKIAKDILYERLPNLKFSSVNLNFVFELTKEELFYEKGEYIYFMILFASHESNTPWIMGQIFTSKYSFAFSNDLKKISFYKKVNKESNENKNKNNKTKILMFIIFSVIGIALVFTIIGCVLGKSIFGLKRKKRANELVDEYEYKAQEDNNNKNDNTKNNYNKSDDKIDPIGINNQKIN